MKLLSNITVKNYDGFWSYDKYVRSNTHFNRLWAVSDSRDEVRVRLRTGCQDYGTLLVSS